MTPIFHIPKNYLSALLFVLLATTLTLSAYWGLTDNFFEIDDIRFIYDAKRTWENPTSFFSLDKSLPGRPVTETVFALIYPIAKHQPAIYHQILILMHLLTGLVLAYALYRLGNDLELSFLAALFFLLNATHVRAVQWISCLAYPLALILGLATILAFRSYLNTSHKHHAITSTFLLTLSGLSHPAALAIAGCCVYLSYEKHGRSIEILKPIWPLLAIGIGLPIALSISFPHMPQAYVTTAHAQTNLWYFGQKYLLFLGALFTRAFWLPVNLGLRPFDIIAGVGVAIVFAVLIYKKHTVTFWIIFTSCTLLPFINVPDEETYSRHLYIASVGSSLILVWATRHLIRHIPRYQQITWTVFLICLLATSIYTLRRSESLSLFASGLYNFTQTTSISGHDIRNELAQLGRDDFIQAMNRDYRLIPMIALRGLYFGQTFPAQVQSAYEIQPQKVEIEVLDTIYRVLNGHYEDARDHIAQIAAQNDKYRPFITQAWYNIGHFYYESGRTDAAIACLSEAIALDGQDPDILHKLGQAKAKQGDIQQAEQYYRKIINLAPDYPYTYTSLMDLLIKQKHPDQALALMHTAPTSVLRYPWVHFHAGIAHESKKDPQQAIQAFDTALKYAPHHATISQLIVDIYIQWAQKAQQQSAFTLARDYLQRALVIAPSDLRIQKALQNLP